MKLLDYQTLYLVGIKGVAMTSLAQCLVDAGKTVLGSDVAEDFVTKKLLSDLGCTLEIGFDHEIPAAVDCVVYTAAHKGKSNPQVQQALFRNIPTYSHAEALGELFNEKQGIAVCGVGGKSTVSAMIAWILEKTNQNPSFSVGVGNIPSLEKTGAWRGDSNFFVAEADEYVVDPAAPDKNEEIVPRFSFLFPQITVCTNLAFDHPDVYRDFDHTKHVYKKFFENLRENGTLIFNADNEALVTLVNNLKNERDDLKFLSFGENENADFRLKMYASSEGTTTGTFVFENEEHQLILKIPGKFNIFNGLSAIATCYAIGVPLQNGIEAVKDFNSTMRRFEYKGKIHGVKCYDDYAHHPSEVKAAITALNEWYPNAQKVVAFQSHTYSRTKQLFDDFVDAFQNTKEVVMIDIFSSAREKSDPTISSSVLCKAIEKKYPHIHAKNLGSIENLANFFKNEMRDGEVFLTLGAGDIYEVYEEIKK